MWNSMKEFMSGIRSMAVGWQVWLAALVTVNFLVPVWYASQLEAQITLAAFFAGSMLGMFLVKLQGFTRLLGLMHIFWFPLIAFLWDRLAHIPVADPLGIWIRAVILLNSISLIIDIVDVGRYLAGERKPVNA